MKSALRIGLTAAALTLPLHAIPQQAVPPPPKPADAGPSLADTMKFIEKTLNNQEPVRFTAHVNYSPSGFAPSFMQTVTLADVHAEAQTCEVRFSMKIARISLDPNNSFGDKEQFEPFTLRLKEASNLKLEPFSVYNAYGMTVNGVAQVGQTTTDIPISVLTVQPVQKGGSVIYIADEEMADRIAKAMVHAIELCAGASKDPF